jgi:hypothetical protein
VKGGRWLVLGIASATVLVACARRGSSTGAPPPTPPAAVAPSAASPPPEDATDDDEDTIVEQCDRLIGTINGVTAAMIAATDAMGNLATDPTAVGQYETAVQMAIDQVGALDLADDGLSDLARRYGDLFERSEPLGAAMVAAQNDVEAAQELVAEAEAIKESEDRLVDDLNAYCERATRARAPARAA